MSTIERDRPRFFFCPPPYLDQPLKEGGRQIREAFKQGAPRDPEKLLRNIVDSFPVEERPFALVYLLRELLESLRTKGSKTDLDAYKREFSEHGTLIDAVFVWDAASEFEDSPRPPNLEQLLNDFPSHLRGQLFEQALPIDTERQHRIGEPCDVYTYWKRFKTDACYVVALCRHFGLPVPGTPWGKDYLLIEVLGIGGMGVVYRAVQKKLQREVALKLMRPDCISPENQRRFFAESQIAGQLDHPAIPPIHRRGSYKRRDYFAMALVEGKTLADLIKENVDRDRLIRIFDQVCSAIGHAHSGGVIHRDLKPANVIVKKQDEVRVADWGLAKRLPVGEASHPERVREALAQGGAITTVPIDTSSEATANGDHLGTPAYMSPEQAQGRIDQLDKQCDVFSLGAVLCEILTGRPPYLASDEVTLRTKAARGDLAEALLRLDGCGADVELVELAKRCLAIDVRKRPPNAGAVAQELKDYLDAAPRRKRAAEKARRRVLVAAAAMVATVLFACGAWVLIERAHAAITEGVDEDLREAKYQLEQARGLPLASAKRASHSLGARSAVQRAEGRLATTVWRHQDLLDRVQTMRAYLEEEDKDRRMIERLAELKFPRFGKENKTEKRTLFDLKVLDNRYATAFREYGIDVEVMTTEDAVAQIRDRRISVELAAGLDCWAWTRQNMLDADPGTWRRLWKVACAADPDSRRNRLRDALEKKDRKTLREVAQSAEAAELPMPTLSLLGAALWFVGDSAEAALLLRTAWRTHPADFEINYFLANIYLAMTPPKWDEAAGFFRAAMATRGPHPNLWIYLGNALTGKKDLDGALAAYEEAVRLHQAVVSDLAVDEEATSLRRNLAFAHFNLGNVWMHKEKYDKAIAAYNQAIGLDPVNPDSFRALGRALAAKGDFDKASVAEKEAARLENGLLEKIITNLNKVIEKHPDDFRAYYNLGSALVIKKDFVGAARAYRESIKKAERCKEFNIDRELAIAHNDLGLALAEQGDSDKALSELSAALKIDPKCILALTNLCPVLAKRGRVQEALEKIDEALKIAPNWPPVHWYRGKTLATKEVYELAAQACKKALKLSEFHEPLELSQVDEAMKKAVGQVMKDRYKLAAEACKKAIELAEFHEVVFVDRKLALVHHDLGNILLNQERVDEAIKELHKALWIDPMFAPAHNDLGVALGKQQGKAAEEIAEYRAALRIDPKFTLALDNLCIALNNFGIDLENKQDYAGAANAYREIIHLRPNDAKAHCDLATLLSRQGKVEEAIDEFRKALKLDPKSARAHNNLGVAMSKQGKVAEGIAEYRAALRIDPKLTLALDNLCIALNNFGIDLENKQDYAGAANAYREIIHLRPNDAKAHCDLATLLSRQGKVEEVIDEFRKALKLDPKSARAHNNLGVAMSKQGKVAEGIAEYRAALRIDPKFSRALVNLRIALNKLGTALENKQDYAGAAKAYQEVIHLRPNDAHAHCNLAEVLSKQGNVEEAIKEYRKGFEFDPKLAWAHNNLGVDLEEQGKRDEAIEEYRKAIKIDPKKPYTTTI